MVVPARCSIWRRRPMAPCSARRRLASAIR